MGNSSENILGPAKHLLLKTHRWAPLGASLARPVVARGPDWGPEARTPFFELEPAKQATVPLGYLSWDADPERIC